MASAIDLAEVAAQPFLAVKGQVNLPDIPAKLMPMMDRVWAFIRERGIADHGHNVWLYRSVGDGRMNVEIGVQMNGAFEAGGDLVAARTPAGKAAHAVHMGDYALMGRTHGALMAWCEEHGHALANIGWEVYGDWREDPAKLRTDVYQLIAS